MKHHHLRTTTLLTLAALALATGLRAGVPEPDAVFYGGIQDAEGVSLAADQTFVLEAEVDGVVLAEGSWPEGSDQYLVRLPHDPTPSSPTLRFYLREVASGKRAESQETQAAPIPVSNLRAPIVAQDLTFMLVELAHPDADQDGMPDAWENSHQAAEGSGMASLDAGRSDANDDNDGDGISNLHEYLAGTHPLNAQDRFQVSVARQSGAGQPCLEFTPAFTDRQYRVRACNRLDGGTWDIVQTVSPGQDGPQSIPCSTLGTSNTAHFFQVEILYQD
jgi:hypothetical protein